jgi:hypothetical protein
MLRGRRQAPPSRRRLIRLRSEAKRQRSPFLRALGDLDQRLLRVLRTRGHGPVSDAAMKALGTAGQWGAVWAAIGLAGACGDRERRIRWLVAGATGPLAIGLNYAVKLAVVRERPLIEGHPPLAVAPSKLSFPSAHATSSLAAATAIGRMAPTARPGLYGLAAGICLSRPYLGMHYPSDVLAGAGLGMVLGRLVPGLRDPDAEGRLVDLVASYPGDGAGPSAADRAASTTTGEGRSAPESTSP